MMKYKKSIVLLTSSLLALSLLLIFTSGLGNEQKASSSNAAVKNSSSNAIVKKNTPTYVTSQGSGFTYNDFADLDAKTDLIVKGKKIKEDKVILTKDGQGLATDYRTISVFEVDKVFKNEINLSLSEGESITVQENAALDGDVVLSTMGYQLMNNDEEYLLFLTPNLTESGVYNIKGVYYGKIPTQQFQGFTKSEIELQFKGDSTDQKTLQAIFQDALNKYNN
jgi:hypothetical protein